jgi:hypothetical protein
MAGVSVDDFFAIGPAFGEKPAKLLPNERGT